MHCEQRIEGLDGFQEPQSTPALSHTLFICDTQPPGSWLAMVISLSLSLFPPYSISYCTSIPVGSSQLGHVVQYPLKVNRK